MFVAPFGMSQKTTVWARILPLAAELAAMKHVVSILVPPWDSPQESDTVLQYQRVGIHRVDIRGGLVPIVSRMMWEIQKFGPDILHFAKPRAYSGICQWLAYQGRHFSIAKPALILLDADDWEQAWNPQLKTWPWVEFFLAWQEEWGLRHSHGVTVASQWLWRRVDAYVPSLSKLYLPNGIPQKYELAGSRKQGPPTVLWFTRFVEIEPSWIADFWSVLQVQIPNCRLIVAGSPVEPGLERPFQEALSANPSGNSRIDWLGYIDPRGLPELYARSHCAVFPVRESAANLAKCSVKLIDIVANGVPCVASQVGEQARFAPLPQVTMLDAKATSGEFVSAVANRLGNPVTLIPQKEGGKSVPTWTELALHLENFYRTLR